MEKSLQYLITYSNTFTTYKDARVLARVTKVTVTI